jgi:hypothetical protein
VYLYRSLCQSEFDQVQTKNLGCRIWEQLKNAQAGNAQVQAEGPKRRTREGGSEWESIKIIFKNSAYEPNFIRAPPQASLAKFT